MCKKIRSIYIYYFRSSSVLGGLLYTTIYYIPRQFFSFIRSYESKLKTNALHELNLTPMLMSMSQESQIRIHFKGMLCTYSHVKSKKIALAFRIHFHQSREKSNLMHHSPLLSAHSSEIFSSLFLFLKILPGLLMNSLLKYFHSATQLRRSMANHDWY